MPETPEARLKRMQMRAARRGMKEMDLILGPYAQARLPEMSAETLDRFDLLLGENDQDLYLWVTGQAPAPAPLAALVAEIAVFGRARLSPQR